ncbi:Rab family GTPase [Phaeodactylibacter xiamenensis]|uniref:Small GTP-binding protein, Ras family n=1 Tax=Phaeodactylibacter xiamenensis TaxID=1524460 RepID=A0A098S811_9BACT|nr:Rab family GTPase [Phaeodactylibacter xiamenensis]KGE87783.1 small GTP-binding protein, Ras family [Phaeodactylibacter xiamenensis]
MTSRKVLITGSFAVGKTSLFHRFVYNTFSDQYLTTIGVKVDKRVVDVSGEPLSLILWDIAGEVSQKKVPKTYFLGASAVIYVFDLSRKQTADNLKSDLKLIQKILPGCLIKVVGNKKDLVSEEELIILERTHNPDFLTSAKTGENVETLFMEIASELVSY